MTLCDLPYTTIISFSNELPKPNTPTRSPNDVTRRIDQLIEEIREKWHKPAMDKGSDQCGDVLLVAHGHILRAFAMRWAGYALHEGPIFLLEAGGVGTLR